MELSTLQPRMSRLPRPCVDGWGQSRMQWPAPEVPA